MSGEHQDFPRKFDLCAICTRGNEFDRVTLCAEERHLDIVKEILTEGSDTDPGAYGDLCRQLLSDLDERLPSGFVFEFTLQNSVGPWPSYFRDQIICEAEPCLLLEYFFAEGSPASSWVWLWLPTFSLNPDQLSEVLRSLANDWYRGRSLLEHAASGKMPMPDGVEISTPTSITRHAYPLVRSKDQTDSPHKFTIQAGKSGAKPIYQRDELNRVGMQLLLSGKIFASQTEFANGWHDALIKQKILAPKPESLRKRVPDLERWANHQSEKK